MFFFFSKETKRVCNQDPALSILKGDRFFAKRYGQIRIFHGQKPQA